MPIALSERRRTTAALTFALLVTMGMAAMSVSFADHPVARNNAPHPSAPNTHSPAAATLYTKMLQADSLYSYRGRRITTYWRNGRAEAVIVSHLPPYYRRTDYLAPDSVRGDSLAEDGVQQWTYDLDQKLLTHSQQTDDETPADPTVSYELLRQNYNLAILSEKQTWADRKAYILTINRKSAKTIAQKLWLDAATGLVLKREIYNEAGKLRVTVAFSDINYHPRLEKTVFDLSQLAKRPGVRRLEQKPSGEKSVPLASVRSLFGASAQMPPRLGGYRLVSVALITTGPKSILHLHYWDGLNFISVFEQTRAHLQRPTRVPVTMRPLNMGGWRGHVTHNASLTAVNWDTPTLNITMMGETAEATLIQLAGLLAKG